ncbi:MAG: M28 family peptidase [Bacteroidetes bacterium]|nr:M28 family peptidase [Bacteroidota bacterium]
MKVIILIYLFVFFYLPAFGLQITGFEPDTLRIQKLISVLGHDSLQGRGTGTPGGVKAANYLASQLNESGLEPAGDEGSWFQNIPLHGSTPLPDSRLILEFIDETRLLLLGQDYLLFKTGAQTFIPKPVQMVFAGYGINAPQYDYNDYQDIDVTGKIVVILTGEPESDDPAWFNGKLQTIYSSVEAKQRQAIGFGAAGCILIPNPRDDYRPWTYWVKEFSFETVTQAFAPAGNLSLLLNPKHASALFSGSGYSYQDVMDMDKFNAIRSFNLVAKLSFSGEFRQRDFMAANVIGKIEGSDALLAETAVLVSAHYDHLGIGLKNNSDSIYNGVFDNAMGVAVTLEIARLLNLPENKPERTVIFILTTGEEKGLLGSQFYTMHPVFPLYRTTANINIDGISSFDEFQDVIGIGSDYSNLGRVLETVLKKQNLKPSKIPQSQLNSESFFRSDHFAFASAGIPSVSILEGTQYKNLQETVAEEIKMKWDQTRYHSPFDDLNQPINWRAVRQHSELILKMIKETAEYEGEIVWNSQAPYRNVRLQTIAEKR